MLLFLMAVHHQAQIQGMAVDLVVRIRSLVTVTKLNVLTMLLVAVEVPIGHPTAECRMMIVLTRTRWAWIAMPATHRVVRITCKMSHLATRITLRMREEDEMACLKVQGIMAQTLGAELGTNGKTAGKVACPTITMDVEMPGRQIRAMASQVVLSTTALDPTIPWQTTGGIWDSSHQDTVVTLVVMPNILKIKGPQPGVQAAMHPNRLEPELGRSQAASLLLEV